MKKKYVEEESENEFSADEPEEFQESSDDWTPASGDASGRRQSRRLRNSTSKKPRLAELSSSEDSDVESEDSNSGSKKRGKGRGRPPVSRVKVQKKPTNTNSSTNDTAKRPTESVVSCEATSTTSPPVQKEFSSGAYVVLKTDIQNGGDPPIWKIDGKALLQKYIPFEQDGKKLYKNTSTYSGWSIVNKDLYYPAPITFKVQNRKEIIVEFHKDQIKATTPHPDDSE